MSLSIGRAAAESQKYARIAWGQRGQERGPLILNWGDEEVEAVIYQRAAALQQMIAAEKKENRRRERTAASVAPRACDTEQELVPVLMAV